MSRQHSKEPEAAITREGAGVNKNMNTNHRSFDHIMLEAKEYNEQWTARNERAGTESGATARPIKNEPNTRPEISNKNGPNIGNTLVAIQLFLEAKNGHEAVDPVQVSVALLDCRTDFNTKIAPGASASSDIKFDDFLKTCQ